MNGTISKSQPMTTAARLAEVPMSSHNRLRATAHLERAEAMADALVWLCDGVKRVFRVVFARPSRAASNLG